MSAAQIRTVTIALAETVGIAVVPEPTVIGVMAFATLLLRRGSASPSTPHLRASTGSFRVACSWAIALVARLSCASSHAQWVTWELAAGGNGHQYQAVPGNQFRAWELAEGGNDHRYQAVPGTQVLTWEIADKIAQARGGYLATITSAAENDFVFGLIDAPQFWNYSINGSGPVIGGFQPDGSAEPAGGWQWTTGEPWAYTNWTPGQPDNGAGGLFEHRLHYFSGFEIGLRANTWNDIPANTVNLGGLVIEAVPEPGALALLGLGAVLAVRRRSGRRIAAACESL